jgi:hypothetical protein
MEFKLNCSTCQLHYKNFQKRAQLQLARLNNTSIMYIQTGELVVHLSTKQTSLSIDRVNFQLVAGLFFWRTAVGV